MNEEKSPVMTLHMPTVAVRVKIKQFEKLESQLVLELDTLDRQRDELIDKIDELHSVIVMLRKSEQDFEASSCCLKKVFG